MSNEEQPPVEEQVPIDQESSGGCGTAGSSCCGAQQKRATEPRQSGFEQSFVGGEIDTSAGPIPRVSTDLTSEDWWGTFKSRWGIGRMDYTVVPGLYGVGSPDSSSSVLVTSNYKMTFDRVRRVLGGRDVWILVLDTDGINVWCAAGEGTFGTDELVGRLESVRLKEIVKHRRLILPQLGGPGVAAHQVKKRAGFKAVYGPIRAEDIPAFIDAGFKATAEMRRKTFTFSERAELIPVELVMALKPVIVVLLVFLFLSGIGGPQGYWANVVNTAPLTMAILVAALIGGAIIFPLLLPWLPGRAFSARSLPIGIVLAVAVLLSLGSGLNDWPGRLEFAGWLLFAPALTAFMAMNFTGASTFTSLSGVKKEMRTAVPLQIGAAVFGLVLWFGSRFVA